MKLRVFSEENAIDFIKCKKILEIAELVPSRDGRSLPEAKPEAIPRESFVLRLAMTGEESRSS